MTLEEALQNEEVLKKLDNADTIDEAVEILQQNGADVSARDLLTLSGEEMGEDELENVTGGGWGTLWKAIKVALKILPYLPIKPLPIGGKPIGRGISGGR